MVRVISAHHFTSQDVTTIPKPCCSTVSGDLLLLASPLHQVEVQDLATSTSSHTFPTVDLVQSMTSSNVGRYLATIETRTGQPPAIRVYVNWWSPQASGQPMRARIAGRVTPGPDGREESLYLQMIELPRLIEEPVTGLAICPSTGNLLTVCGNTLVVYKYCLVGSGQSQANKTKFVDFQECIQLQMCPKPDIVRIVEDTFACLSRGEVHIFKTKITEGEADVDKPQRSLSTYSFSSESESSMEAGMVGDITNPKPGVLNNPNISNVTARRRTDSSSEREVHGNKVGYKRHPGHVFIGGSSSSDEEEVQTTSTVERVSVPLVDRIDRELGSVSTPRILEQVLGPTNLDLVKVVLVPSAWMGCKFSGEAITLVHAKVQEEEKQHEHLQLLQMLPVYWREFRLRRDRGAQSPSSNSPHNPLQSMMYTHLMSLTVMFCSVHEGYLYHVPGHIRRPGKGLGVMRVATYPFTSPIMDLVLEPSLLHALTETGLETYTLQSGYHTIREAETLDNKTNACPPTSTPICLIGLRPFLGVECLQLGYTRLVLMTRPEPSQQLDCTEWTVNSLNLPSHLDLYRDMLAVAQMNSAAPHGYLQLVCEAHLVVRTWLHRLTWLQVMQPSWLPPVTPPEVDAVRSSYWTSCVKLADHYLYCKSEKQYSLALPYYRMSNSSPHEILEKIKVSTPLPRGVIKYIEELLQNSQSEENALDAAVTDKIINLLGQHSLSNLVRLVLISPSLRVFKTRHTLDFIERDLQVMNKEFSVDASQAIAAVLLGGLGDWLSLVPPVSLSNTILENHHLLFDKQSQGSQESFSDFAITTRLEVPIVFVEVCVSLIESKLCSLGQVLHLLLQTFMSLAPSPKAAADNAGILQLFLETYFVELISESSNIQASLPLDPDQQQALLTLVRSYLAGLVHPIPGPAMDDSVLLTGPADMFGPRPDFLDLLPPFTTLTNLETKQTEEPTLLKLQSLLSSPFCCDNCRDTVDRYVNEHPGVVGELSLQLLAMPGVSKEGVVLLANTVPTAVTSYCKSAGNRTDFWSTALESLLARKTANREPLDKLLREMAEIFPPDKLVQLVPDVEEFQYYLTESKRIHQAARMQELIVATGQKLLDSLTL